MTTLRELVADHDRLIRDELPALPEIDLSDPSSWDGAAANQAFTSLQKLRAAKAKQIRLHDEAIKGAKVQKDVVEDAFNSLDHSLDSALRKWAKGNIVEGKKHAKLPAGKVVFGDKATVLSFECEEDVLQANLKKMAKNKDTRHCVRVTVAPEKRELTKWAIEQGELPTWLKLVKGHKVSYVPDGSAPTKTEVATKEEVPANAGAPKSDSKAHEASSGEQGEDTNTSSASKPKPVRDAPKGTDTSLRPRIFVVPEDEHFVKSALSTNENIFNEMKIDRLLAEQSRVTPDHIRDLPMAKIMGGVVKMTQDELGFDRNDTKKWIAYHMGVHFEALEHDQITEGQWRQVLALAVHAVTIRKKKEETLAEG